MRLGQTGEDDRSPSTPLSKHEGIAGRVEAAAKAKVPPPKGKGLVMMLIMVAVLAGLIYDLSTRGGASGKVRDMTRAQGEPMSAKEKAGEALEVTVRDEGQDLTLTASAAIAYYTAAPAEKKAKIRPKLLKAIAAEENLDGQRAQEAYELATRLLEGAGSASEDAITDLATGAIGLLGSDEAAPAAIFFLGAMPDGLEKSHVRALDKVVLDKRRPLHVRTAAASALPKDRRSDAVNALAADGNTHPALRKALE